MTFCLRQKYLKKSDAYKNIYSYTWDNKIIWKFRIKGVISNAYESEIEALDIFLIKQDKDPLNILKRQ